MEMFFIQDYFGCLIGSPHTKQEMEEMQRLDHRLRFCRIEGRDKGAIVAKANNHNTLIKQDLTNK